MSRARSDSQIKDISNIDAELTANNANKLIKPLFVAVDLNDQEMFLKSLEELPTDEITNLAFSPLNFAVQQLNFEFTTFLLDLRKNPKTTNQKSVFSRGSKTMSSLVLAVEIGNKEMVDLLTKYRFGCADSEGKSALMHAAIQGNLELCQALKSCFGKQDNFGYTALHFACAYKFTEIVKFLVSEKDIVNSEGQKPIDICKQMSYQEGIDILQ
ncbi:Ankyrin repeat-containing protein [Spironucleus salmonicida]|uniref:Ankyrin repeat-containing protein n=1 Tax=Spironucleus salmonicida TaxID=348837 RepID=V6LNQ3_9EUKA|nr:Ankyrin repeat-containing protein [Spironucleus salmonicida]|eukprot:EST45873.1 Ankyrin repeat-containing protein [Spironucleus salmonicida]